jgi:cbb3-type cytochrome oxidase subunit 1
VIDLSVQDRATQDRLARLCRRYIRVSFFYLALGLLLGTAMLLFGNDNFLFVHSHLLLVGFVLFLIYGIGYKLIPTMFFGLPRVVHIGLAEAQFWMANVGLAGMLVGAVMPVGLGLDRISVLFALVEAAAGILFAVLMGKTIGGK